MLFYPEHHLSQIFADCRISNLPEVYYSRRPSVFWYTLQHSQEMRCCDCCVPSEGICLCFIPSQDSRRERSNNFQAFVKMALETLLGSCRRKHGGPRGRQGWGHFPSVLSPWAYRLGCCMALQYSICSPLTEAENLIPIHYHLSLFLPFPTSICPLPLTVHSSLLDARE